MKFVDDDDDLVRQPGTLCHLSYVTRPSHLTVLGITENVLV